MRQSRSQSPAILCRRNRGALGKCRREQPLIGCLIITRTDVASVGSVFNDTRKVKVLSLPETIKEKSTFRAKALRRELVVGGRGKIRVVFPDPPLLTPDEGPSLETSIFSLSFQIVRESLPFAYV